MLNLMKVDSLRQSVAKLDSVVGYRLRALREAQGMPQQHIATVLRASYGIEWHQTTVAKVEAGSRALKLKEAVAVALTLGVPLDFLFGEADNAISTAMMRYATDRAERVRDAAEADLARIRKSASSDER